MRTLSVLRGLAGLAIGPEGVVGVAAPVQHVKGKNLGEGKGFSLR